MNSEWIEEAKKLHNDLRLYIECVQKYAETGQWSAVEEEHLLKQLDELRRIENDE